MGTWSIWHWLVVLAIVVLIFGTRKLKNFGGDLGGAIKAFKQSMKDGESEAAAADKTAAKAEPVAQDKPGGDKPGP